MTRTVISRVEITGGGYNLTNSADYATMGIGTDNGVEIPYNPNDVIVLNNPTAGAAVYTFVMPQPGEYAEQGATIPDVTESVPASETVLYPMRAIYKQANGNVFIDCDVAGEIMALAR